MCLGNSDHLIQLIPVADIIASLCLYVMQVMWLVLKFFLLATEISVVSFSLWFGEFLKFFLFPKGTDH